MLLEKIGNFLQEILILIIGRTSHLSTFDEVVAHFVRASMRINIFRVRLKNIANSIFFCKSFLLGSLEKYLKKISLTGRQGASNQYTSSDMPDQSHKKVEPF